MNRSDKYKQKWSLLKKEHHHKCVFNDLHSVVGRNLEVDFDNDSGLVADFFCYERYQGYEGMIHDGLLKRHSCVRSE